MQQFWKEARRKAFHMASLLYLAAYELIGYPRVVLPLILWTVFVTAVELGRLYWPRLNEALFSVMGGLSRSEERKQASGILHTTLGVLVLVLAFGADARLVSASIFCVALGDAAAALVGKTLGRHKLPWSKKSWEGSWACFLACLLVCVAHGYNLGASLFAALVSTLIEYLPTTPWFNDNLWIPLGAACALRTLA